jgi:histidinol-phosphate phosphatase family protein
MSRPACFLDRDGTLVIDRGYARRADEIALLPGAATAVRRLNEHGIAAVLVSNQSAIGRGFCTARDVADQNERLRELLRGEAGASLDGIYVCPHRPEEGCPCRKPGGALVAVAARELDLDLARSYAIGDQAADVELGVRWLAGGVLVRTGMGEATYAVAGTAAYRPDRVFADVLAAVTHLLATGWR